MSLVKSDMPVITIATRPTGKTAPAIKALKPGPSEVSSPVEQTVASVAPTAMNMPPMKPRTRKFGTPRSALYLPASPARVTISAGLMAMLIPS